MSNEIKDIINKILFRLAFKLQREMRENLVRNGTNDRGMLSASIMVEKQGNAVVIGSNLVYAPAVEFGTRPHFPPIEELEGWAKRKLHAENPQQAAEAIAWKIYHYGTPQQPFMRPAIDKAEEFLKEAIDEVTK